LGLRQGIQITGIRQSLLRGSGIRDGFVVTRIDGRPVASMADVNKALASAVNSGDRGVLIEGVYPSGEHGYYGVSLPQN
jgi:S1-C subfamily serine protease